MSYLCRLLLAAGATHVALAAEECQLSLPPGIHKIPLRVGGRERHFLAVVPTGPRVEGKLVPASEQTRDLL